MHRRFHVTGTSRDTPDDGIDTAPVIDSVVPRIVNERDTDGTQRDADAERRDANAVVRDLSSDLGDDDGDIRDVAAEGRDQRASQRDDAADNRELAAAGRDRAADERDRAADERDRVARVSAGPDQGVENDSATTREPRLSRREEAASDRRHARKDRTAAAAERSVAALDRSTSLLDRVAGATGRDSSGVDRDSSGLDRETARHDRDSSGLDRETARDDRAASANDRKCAVEREELNTLESETRAWGLLQGLPDPVVVADANGIIELINLQAVALFGYQPEELLGQPVELLIPTGLHHAAYVAAEESRPMNTGPGVVAVRKDGTTVPVEINLSAIALSSGRAVLASIRDVSDRTLADAKLRISDERFRVSFDRAPIGMALIDLHRKTAGRLLQVNLALRTLTGFTEAELLERTSPQITHPDDRDETVAGLKRMVDGEASQWNTDKRYVTASGEDVWVHFAVSVVLDANGRPSYGVSQVEDITDRKQAEAQMAERFNELATNVDVGFLIHQLDPPKSLYFNPAYLKVFGLDWAGMTPTPDDAADTVGPDSVGELASLLEFAKSGQSLEREFPFTRPGGERRWVTGRVSPIVDEDGEIRRVVGLFGDITDRKNAEVAVEAAQAEAEQANKAKDAFLSRMSHELRTPLNAVLGFAQLLELDTLTRTQHDAVSHILRGGRHLLTMIDDILDITGIEANRLELAPEPVQIALLIQDALGLVAPLATASHVLMYFDAQQEAARLYIRADQRRLKQVLTSLLDNAIRYNTAGGRVDVRLALRGGDQLSISIIDTGMGIPADALPRLFDPFDRLGRQDVDIDGTGIGLVLAKRLTTLMGGRIDVETVEGSGSTFTVTLPITTALHAVGTMPPQPPVVAAALRKSTLVYIEDNPSNVDLMAGIMGRRPNWVMSHASTGLAGLQLVAAERPTAVLLDLHLPDTDGTDVLHALRADPATRDVPVAIFSADASPAQIARNLHGGAQRYLTKPLDIAEILGFLDTYAG